MRVLIAGATGLVGSQAARRLSKEGVHVRGLVRASSDADKVRGLEQAGVETAVGDLRDARSLQSACEGVDVVVSTVSASPFSWGEDSTFGDIDRDGTIRLVDAAKEAGAKRFVYVSFPHGPEPGFPLGDAKAAAEVHIANSGLEYCIVAANFFMEVWLSPAFGFDYGTGSATIPGEGTNKCSFVSLEDVARVVSSVAKADSAPNAVVSIGGPQALSPLDAVKTFESMGGKKWEVKLIPVEELQKQMKGASNEFEQSVAALQIAYATMPSVMDPKDYPIKDGLRSVEDYARSVLQPASTTP